MKTYKSGEQFVDFLYQELINSEGVRRAISRKGINPNSREEAIKIYFERLERAHNNLSPGRLEFLKEYYYDRYVIDHLPESYVEFEKRRAREEGHGDITVTDEIRIEMLRTIQENQKSSLDKWIIYLNSPDAMYPMWFKYYAFQGMLKLGQYDKEKKKFSKRTPNTVIPFIDVNPEILAKMYTILTKMIEGTDMTEEELKALKTGESFPKLYTHLTNEFEARKVTGTKGKWIKYEQGDNYQPLFQSLQGKNTGWCTAGEETCKHQVKNGDFYVYYTYDENGNLTNPRIAIRMNGQYHIGEIRGIAKDQNLEPEMEDILAEKFTEFSKTEVESHYKKVHDMKQLTQIEKKVDNNEELTIDEIIFLYELESDIKGFGWHKDPRVEEIKQKRNIREDLKMIEGLPNFKQLIIKALKNNDVRILEYYPELKRDREFIIKAVKANGAVLGFISDELKKDREIALAAIASDASAIDYVAEELKGDREFMLEAVKANGTIIGYIPEELRNDREVVLAAVRGNGYLLGNASEELKRDREIVLAAVTAHGRALLYASEELKHDREIVLEAVTNDYHAFEYAAEELRNDREIALTAVAENDYVLEFVSDELKNDREFMLEVIKINSFAIIYASEELKNDREFILEGLKYSTYVLQFSSEELKKDRDFILEAVKENPFIIEYISEELKSDREIALAAIAKASCEIGFVAEELRSDREFMLEAAKINFSAITYASEELRSDREFILEATKINSFAITYASEELRSDREFMLEVVKIKSFALTYASEEIRSDREFMLEAAKIDFSALEYASEELQKDESFVLENIKQNFLSLIYLNVKPLNKGKFVLAVGQGFITAIITDGKEFISKIRETLNLDGANSHKSR